MRLKIAVTTSGGERDRSRYALTSCTPLKSDGSVGLVAARAAETLSGANASPPVKVQRVVNHSSWRTWPVRAAASGQAGSPARQRMDTLLVRKCVESAVEHVRPHATCRRAHPLG